MKRTEKIRKELIDIGLPHPIDIIACKRLTFYCKMDSTETNILQRLWRVTIPIGKKIRRNKKELEGANK